jgi:membrane-bound ClpP family serine protease
MFRNAFVRRLLEMYLIVVGVLLLLLAPAGTIAWAGGIMMVVGFLLESISIALEQRNFHNF